MTIVIYMRHPNQNYNEIPSHTSKNKAYQINWEKSILISMPSTSDETKKVGILN